MTAVDRMANTGTVSFDRQQDGTLVIRLSGAWLLHAETPSPTPIEQELAVRSPRRVTFDATGLGEWDSAVLTFLTRVSLVCQQRNIPTERDGLPQGVQRLLALAEAVPERGGARHDDTDETLLRRIGEATLTTRDSLLEMLRFLGEITIAFGKLIRWRARYRRSDLILHVQQAGAEALPIVTLISFLVGLILAFVGAIQLQQFGASIYVADLVGIAMVREMGAMMTAIVMAGRTGASYAAQLGSMKVTQEIDALTTMGISPLEFLVLPRMIALALMMPLLCLYSDLMGIVGGAAVGVSMLNISARTYFEETFHAVQLGDLAGGIFKASVYGVLIALSGCLRGMQTGNSSSAVGESTTAAVVTSIVFIISACGTFAVVFYLLGI